MTITLNPTEQKICQWLANQRNDTDHNSGVIDAKIGKRTGSYEINLEGVASEFAFCKLFNLFPDFSIEPRSGGCDCIKDGKRIDVKSTRYQTNTHLVVKKSTKRGQSDIYALMVGLFPTYRYAGYATEEQIFQEKNLKSWGYEGKEAYSIPEKELII